MEVKELLGKTFVSAEKQDDEVILFTDTENIQYKMYHQQDCCESVTIDDIVGDLQDLVGSPLTMAEESSSQNELEYGDSETWTFYKFATVKGYVTIKWYGISNGYYSESVNLVVVGSDDDY